MSSNIYPCTKCGKLITRKGILCIQCYKEKRKLDAISKGRKIRVRNRPIKSQPASTAYKCIKCGKKLWYMGICPKCHENKKANGSYIKRTVVIDTCSKSPSKAHHYIINNDTNIGKCKYCPKEKQFEINYEQ